MSLATVVLATARDQIADFIEALVLVYFILIIAYILLSLLRTAGVRIPYNAATNAVETFLRDAVEPYLGLFRRFIPPLGPLDLSPIVAILVLNVVGSLVVRLVQG